MSRMLQALQNLSDRPPEFPAADDSAAPSSPAHAAAPLADPVSGAGDHTRRMKELLLKHLATPTPSELMRHLRAEIQRPHQDNPGNMTVPLDAAMLAPPSSHAPQERDDAWESESVRESISLTFPMTGGEPEATPAGPAGKSPAADVTQLLATIEEEAESPEEVAVSFTGEEPAKSEEQTFEASDRQADEPPPGPVLQQPQQLIAEPVPLAGPDPVAASQPSSATAAAPAAASALDHLADARPLVAYQPEEDETPPAPAPLKLPPRTISRSKTRLEQRVIDNLADPARSTIYRDLADRLSQDLRLLSGRCLLFAGIGQASHSDDLLAHLAALVAEENEEVLLVDADFTRARLSVGLGALKETGLGELLEHSGRSDELVLPTLLPNVSLLPAGRKALPDSLGVVDQLAQLLAQVERRYALTLIDGGIHTQPLSPSLSRLCDATYFVVRLGSTDARTANTALKAFRGCGARVMGCVATSAT